MASIERLQAQSQGDKIAQQEAARIEAQWLGDRIAQEATIKKLKAELKNAQSEYERYQQLSSEGAISNSLFDSKFGFDQSPISNSFFGKKLF